MTTIAPPTFELAQQFLQLITTQLVIRYTLANPIQDQQIEFFRGEVIHFCPGERGGLDFIHLQLECNLKSGENFRPEFDIEHVCLDHMAAAQEAVRKVLDFWARNIFRGACPKELWLSPTPFIATSCVGDQMADEEVYRIHSPRVLVYHGILLAALTSLSQATAFEARHLNQRRRRYSEALQGLQCRFSAFVTQTINSRRMM